MLLQIMGNNPCLFVTQDIYESINISARILIMKYGKMYATFRPQEYAPEELKSEILHILQT